MTERIGILAITKCGDTLDALWDDGSVQHGISTIDLDRIDPHWGRLVTGPTYFDTLANTLQQNKS